MVVQRARAVEELVLARAGGVESRQRLVAGAEGREGGEWSALGLPGRTAPW